MATNKEQAQNAPTRQEKQKEKETISREQRQEKKKASLFRRANNKNRVRMIPIWAKLIITLVLLAFSAIGGLLIGYALIGEGDSIQILSIEKWQRLFEFINGE